MSKLSNNVLSWFAHNGRKNLPWQKHPTSYRVWISEIMLQQTQVATVIPYFERFMSSFPTIQALATADIDQILHHWTGLGYYARARNLHKTANIIVAENNGELPADVEQLCDLPGIGRSTAGAIVAIAYNKQASILDGNVKRVLTRAFGVEGWPEQTQVKTQLWQLADRLTPELHVAEYTQAMMDLGATVCTRSNPSCPECPFSNSCVAFQSDSIDLYPGKKPKKSMPVKQVAMFMLQNKHNEVLLQKRPPTGIWGSLWSFPEAEKGSDQPDLLDTSIKVESSSKWPEVRHTFSHYHLDITPVHEIITTSKNTIMDSDRWLWYPLNKPLEVGLAAPVKKLLSQLAQQSSHQLNL
jgi:A/G-specific adenine glycosylase